MICDFIANCARFRAPLHNQTKLYKPQTNNQQTPIAYAFIFLLSTTHQSDEYTYTPETPLSFSSFFYHILYSDEINNHSLHLGKKIVMTERGRISYGVGKPYRR